MIRDQMYKSCVVLVSFLVALQLPMLFVIVVNVAIGSTEHIQWLQEMTPAEYFIYVINHADTLVVFIVLTYLIYCRLHRLLHLLLAALSLNIGYFLIGGFVMYARFLGGLGGPPIYWFK